MLPLGATPLDGTEKCHCTRRHAGIPLIPQYDSNARQTPKRSIQIWENINFCMMACVLIASYVGGGEECDCGAIRKHLDR